MQLTIEEINKLPFQAYQKIAPLRARSLTKKDFQQRKGVIQSKEGLVSFQPGDFLARGVEGEEWPIAKEHLTSEEYTQVTPPDRDGFASYRATNVREAYQMSEEFSLNLQQGDILKGKAGDYIVRSEGNVWIVDRAIFEKSYERLS